MSIASKSQSAEPAIPARVAPKSISTAPKPAPAISATTTKNVDWRSDAASEEEFTRGFDDMLKNRQARR